MRQPHKSNDSDNTGNAQATASLPER